MEYNQPIQKKARQRLKFQVIEAPTLFGGFSRSGLGGCEEHQNNMLFECGLPKQHGLFI